VVAQICGSYETVDLGATQAVAEILSRYLIELGYAAHRYAEIGGRATVDVCDVLFALVGLGCTFERLIRSTGSHAVPFTQTIPQRLRVSRLPKRAPAFRELGHSSFPHYPKYLPSFPDEHTLHTHSKYYRRAGGTISDQKLSKNLTGELKACYDRRKRKKMSCELVSSRHYDFENLASVTEDLWFSCTARELGHHEEGCLTSLRSLNACSYGGILGGANTTLRTHGEMQHFNVYSDFARARKRPLNATTSSFREHTTCSHADHSVVNKLIGGCVSVFESN